MKGRGGHGASPESTIDPIVIAAKLDRRPAIDRQPRGEADRPGSRHGRLDPRRHKHNIISDECKLQLTLRSLSPEVRQQLHDAVRRKALAAAASAGAPEPTIEISEGTPALFNDPKLTEQVAAMLERQVWRRQCQCSASP